MRQLGQRFETRTLAPNWPSCERITHLLLKFNTNDRGARRYDTKATLAALAIDRALPQPLTVADLGVWQSETALVPLTRCTRPSFLSLSPGLRNPINPRYVKTDEKACRNQRVPCFKAARGRFGES